MMEDQSDEEDGDCLPDAPAEALDMKKGEQPKERWTTQEMLRRQSVKQADRSPPGSVSVRPDDPRGPGHFFYFGGKNGASIVVSYCESRGWLRIHDNTRVDYKLKWCEVKSHAAYRNFNSGRQMIYQIPNNKVLTTKIGLLNSLRVYERVSSKINYGPTNRTLRMDDFLPQTFRMDLKEDRETFSKVSEDKSIMWICKPSGLNQGRGIFLLRTPEDVMAFGKHLQETVEQLNRASFNMIVQRYIREPLLLKGRKFDVRSYFLIASTSPYMVFFRHGYVRLTCSSYDPDSDNITSHLTNQYMQKKNPLYHLLKEETVWSMERFNAYINDTYMLQKGLPKDWAMGAFAKKMQHIIMQCFLAVKAKLDRKLGYFDLIGCDFLIDEDFKVWLLEMNCNPALHTNCEVLKDVIPRIVNESLDLTIEIFNKTRCGLKLLPLHSQRDFLLLKETEARNKTKDTNSNLSHKSSSFLHNSIKTRNSPHSDPKCQADHSCTKTPETCQKKSRTVAMTYKPHETTQPRPKMVCPRVEIQFSPGEINKVLQVPTKPVNSIRSLSRSAPSKASDC